MKQEIFAFKFGNMPVSVRRSAAYGSVLLLMILTIAALVLTDLTPLDAFLAAILGTLLHWVSALVHQYGHFFAARHTGYPSTGVALWGLLSTTKYPAEEAVLPPKIHIQRAMGGPLFSFGLGLLVLLLALLWLVPMGGMARFLAYWMLLDNWGVFVLGALFPPLQVGKFANDGGTIWYWLRQPPERSPRIL